MKKIKIKNTFKQPYLSSFFNVSFPLKSNGSSHSTKSSGLIEIDLVE